MCRSRVCSFASCGVHGPAHKGLATTLVSRGQQVDMGFDSTTQFGEDHCIKRIWCSDHPVLGCQLLHQRHPLIIPI